MTDTPYTLTTMALADACSEAYAKWMDSMTNLKPNSATTITFKEAYFAAREVLLTHLRAAQAVPEDECEAEIRRRLKNSIDWMTKGNWSAGGCISVPDMQYCLDMLERRRTPDPVGHEARRRAYQEGHRDGMEEAAQYLDGLHRTANKQHNYYQYAANCIRLATKPAQEPNRSQKMHEAGYARRPSPFGCEECGMVFGGVAQLQAHDCTKPAQEGDHV